MQGGLRAWVLSAPASEPCNSRRRHARHRDGAGSFTANGAGRVPLVAMVQAGALPAQDGHLMSQGDEFEFQGEATTNPERERGTEGGQKREHADDGMTGVSKRYAFRAF